MLHLSRPFESPSALMFGREVEEHAKAHCRSVFPMEGCGVVAGGTFVPCFNIHDDLENHFAISPQEFSSIEQSHGHVDAVIHSHTHRDPWPSAHDMREQIRTGVPWGIVPVETTNFADQIIWFGNQVSIAPLIGRPFIPGVWDCYGLVRDWYRLNTNIVPSQVPRDSGWWERGENLLLENLEICGFDRISHIERPGDCMLWAMGKERIFNHCGVYVGDEKILHHFSGHASRESIAGPWLHTPHLCVRHKDLK